MFDPTADPEPRTAVLIALASHGGLLKANFAPDELKQHADRIKQITDGELLAARATDETIQAAQAAVSAAAMIPIMVAATTIH